MEARTFHWVDYLVFAISLSISTCIGLYYGCIGDKQATTFNYLLGNKSLRIIPVALSLQASFLSAIFVLGTAAEIMIHGTMFSYIAIAYLIAFPLAAHFFVPVFHRCNIVSCYEYLQLRFSKSVRRLGSAIFVLMMVLYMGVVLYAPALALSQVSGLSMLLSLLGIGLICTFYTSLGGMKAVVFTDAFQMIVILLALITLLIKALFDVGGVSKVFDIAKDGGRIQFSEFSADSTVRHSFWTQVIGGSLMTLSLYGANQAMIQRYASLPNAKKAQGAVYFAMVSQIVFLILVVFIGIVMYAFYSSCDPIKAGRIKHKDQLVPLFVMDILGEFHGLPGLFTSAIFSAALSTVSSGVNSLAAVVLEDFAKPVFKWRRTFNMTDKNATYLSKIIAVFFGLLTIGVAYLTKLLGNMVLQISLSVFGLVGGPLLGVFFCGIFLPFVEYLGALFGLGCSLIVLIILQTGSIIHKFPVTPLPANISGCINATVLYVGDMSTKNTSEITSYNIFKTSYMWYTPIGCLVCILAASTVSWIRICITKEKQFIDPNLTYEWPDISSKILPKFFKINPSNNDENRKSCRTNNPEKDTEESYKGKESHKQVLLKNSQSNTDSYKMKLMNSEVTRVNSV
ncbi:DgyrCDS1285 [Dimorphilus gyrociliatus]|uniref:DgyrCDS1285 n=1 Tax=Dimorphilus gyrociliatus TaxID=2664684 RepID=A0A7I8V6T7_9ANNE|nr:DgyrCDS1285 [Dimorphilus gyrociliatus]